MGRDKEAIATGTLNFKEVAFTGKCPGGLAVRFQGLFTETTIRYHEVWMMNSVDSRLTEQHIADLVRRFYERAMADTSLRPIFEASIQDWETHHRIVEDFWSRTLLNTDRYRGTPYSLHARLPLRPEHFDRWLALFRETALEVLPAAAADKAIARTEHMAESFKAGMFHGYEVPPGPSLGKSAI